MNGRPLFSIEFSLDGAGSIGTVPVFASHGSQVSKARLDNMGVFVADYVPARPETAIVE
jgi:hypothetical protein